MQIRPFVALASPRGGFPEPREQLMENWVEVPVRFAGARFATSLVVQSGWTGAAEGGLVFRWTLATQSSCRGRVVVVE